MDIVIKPISEILPYKNNPRINKEAVSIVRDSLKAFGFKQPIVLDSNNEIIVGHTRFYAALELQIKEIPCLIAKDLN